VPGTRYARLSKLVLQMAVAGQTRRLVERIRQIRTRTLTTTAFTDRAVSMKYRGVLQLYKRGQTKEGQKFLVYSSAFNTRTWTETLTQWRQKTERTSDGR
jgi:hypothetical protein